MKKMRTILALLLAMMMVLVLFAGCSDSGSKTPADTSSKTEEKAEEKKEETKEEVSNFIYDGDSPIASEPVTVTMICGAGGSAVNYDNIEDMLWIQAIIDKSGLDMEVECLDSSSYGDNIRPRLAAAEDLPDIIQVPGLDTDLTYANSGIFYDLTDFFDEYAYNLKWRFETNPTVKGQATTPDGKMFYIPGINMSVDYCPAILYNQFWLQKIGMDAPTTTDELYEVLKAMKGVDFNGNGKDDEVPLFAQTGYLQCFGSSWGLDIQRGYWENEDGIVEPSYISERYLDYLQYFNKIYTEGLMVPDFASISADMNNEMATNDQFGFIMHYLNFCHSFSQKYYAGKGQDWDTSYGELAWVPLEAPPKGPFGHQLYNGNDPVFGFWAISAKSEVPEYAFAFCDYLYSEEANNFMYYGIYENGDYEIKDGKIYPDLAKRSKDDYSTRMGNNFGGFPRILLAAHRDVSYNYTIGEYNEILNDYYRLPVPAAFALPKEVDTVSAYAADLSTYWGENYVAFITGTRPLSEFDDYCETLKSMHYEDMVAVKQAALDRVKGKN
ncbi:MAG: extracellular solute-binding protein [Clostridiales bacterium]|nr:extracellular solute-binding protein [Clostridiales bacterium]